MLHRILVSCALCLSSGIAGDDTASISGRVLNSATQVPVKGASIFLHRAGRAKVAYATTTNIEGEYRVSGIAPGAYRLDAECDGYQARAPGGRKRKPLMLAAGQVEKDLTISLAPLGVIGGRILAEDGTPKAGVQVNLLVLRDAEDGGAPTALIAKVFESNDLGEYRLHGLSPDRYVLCAEWRTKSIDWEVDARPAANALRPVLFCSCWSGSVSPERATPIDLAPGANLNGIEMTLRSCPLVSVRGRVVPAPGKVETRSAGVSMMRQFRWPPENHESKLDADGHFAFSSVAPGVYYLDAGYVAGSVTHRGHLKLEVGTEPIDDLQVQVNPVQPFGGTFVAESGVKLDYSRVQVLFSSPVTPSGAFTDRGGKFEVRGGISSGVYRWRVSGLPANAYVKSARLGDADVTNSDLDLSQPVAAKLEITVSPDGGEMQGIVTGENSEPVEDATVALVPSGEQRGRRRMFDDHAMTDWQGHFTFHGIAPGDYMLFAWEQVQDGRWYDVEFMKQHESAGVAVSIREKSKETRALKAIPAQAAR